MGNISTGKIIGALMGLTVIGIVAASLSGVFNKDFTDGGVDVRNTACEDIGTARQAVAAEFEQRQAAAGSALEADRDKASDDYWAQNQKLEREYHECISRALTADPCKEPFEEVGRLYEEIMADFEAGKGFNEAKFNEREAAKKRYNDCVEETRKPEFYPEKEAACEATLSAGREANQQNRVAVERSAQVRHDQSVARAESARQQKSAILDAIEEKCKEPAGNTNVNAGVVTTGGTGTQVKPTSSACTGVFSGNDPELQKQLSDLENQLSKAKAAGLSGGLFGIDHIQQAIDEVRQQLKESQRSCETDADCGDPEPVCCSGTQVGRVFCDDGVCAHETIDCEDPEICTGKPAQCLAPATGVTSQPLQISRTIPEIGSCSQNLQSLNLQKGGPDSDRFEITGNIPSWLHFDKVSGKLPANVNITYSCNTVQGFGPGTYTVNGSIQIYDGGNQLINTIPLNVAITVTPSEKVVDVIMYGGKYIPLDQVHRFSGPECDEDEHWHANSGSARTLDGSSVPDTGDCGYGKTKDVPVISVPDTRGTIEVRGLEGLRN